MVHEVVVQWPLRICGAGGLPEHTVLRAPKGVDYAIDFFAAAMLVNVKVESCRSCAVIHSKGRLYLERCMLSCETQGACVTGGCERMGWATGVCYAVIYLLNRTYKTTHTQNHRAGPPADAVANTCEGGGGG